VFVVERSQLAELQAAVDYIAKYLGVTDRLILVDDGSPVEWEEPLCVPECAEVFYQRENKGFTRAVNRVIKECGAGTKWLIIANSDVSGEDDWRQILTCEDALLFPAPSARLPWFPPGFFFGGHVSVFDKLGLLDEDMRIFFSDSDYYARAMQAGVKLLAHRDVVVRNKSRSTVHRAIRSGYCKPNQFDMDRQTFERKWKGNPLYDGMLTFNERKWN